MPQLTDDCFAHGGPMMTTAEALARIGEIASAVTDSETVPLASAAGRILAADITAEGDVPPHDNSAVDGYAVYFDDLNSDGESRLPVTGRIAAGHPLEHPARRGEAVRIFTGAAMPSGDGGGPDTIMMQEDCREDGGLARAVLAIDQVVSVQVGDLRAARIVTEDPEVLDPSYLCEHRPASPSFD